MLTLCVVVALVGLALQEAPIVILALVVGACTMSG